MLAKIEQRRRDPNLYLAVIGEFSSGKSTFLNALIGEELLRSDVLQATTGTVVWLGHGDKLNLDARSHDGGSFRKGTLPSSLLGKVGPLFQSWGNTEELNEFRTLLAELTSNEEIASKLEQVTVEYPSELLDQGLVICDTPGANANIARHVEVARNVVRSECDTAIVIIPADRPVSQSLVSFVQSTLGDAVHRCIFLVTRIDMIPARERGRLMDVVRQRLVSQLGIENPYLLSCSPQAVIDQLNDEVRDVESNELLVEEFEHVVASIWTSLAQGRALLQAERIGQLTVELSDVLTTSLTERREEIERQRTSLAENQVPNLRHFIEEWKRKVSSELWTAAESEYPQLEDDLVSTTESFSEQIVGEIDERHPRLDLLKEYMEDGFQRLRSVYVKNIQAHVKRCDVVLAEAHQTTLKTFSADFAARYDSLARSHALPMWTATGSYSHTAQIAAANSGFLQIQVDNALEDEAGSMMGFGAGGAALGAIAGTFFLPIPGLGTVVGAAVGGWAASLLGADSDERYQETASKISESLEQFIYESVQGAADAFEESVQLRVNEAESFVEQHFEKFSSLYEAAGRAYEREKQRMEKSSAQVQRDLNVLQERERNLDRWQRTMRKTAARGSDV